MYRKVTLQLGQGVVSLHQITSLIAADGVSSKCSKQQLQHAATILHRYNVQLWQQHAQGKKPHRDAQIGSGNGVVRHCPKQQKKHCAARSSGTHRTILSSGAEQLPSAGFSQHPGRQHMLHTFYAAQRLREQGTILEPVSDCRSSLFKRWA